MSQEDAGKSPGNEGCDDQPEGIPPANGNDVRKSWSWVADTATLLGESGIFVWIVVDLLRDPGMLWWLKLLLWIAACLVLSAISHTIYSKIWPKKGRILIAYSLLVLALLFVAFRPIPEPERARFTFVLNTEDFPRMNLELTNEYLLPKTAGMEFVCGCLFVPCEADKTNIVFKITARNDSNVTAKDGFVGLWLSEGWQFSLDPGWVIAESPTFWAGAFASNGTLQEKEATCRVCRLNPAVLPGNGEILPAIRIAPKAFVPYDGALMMRLAARAEHSTANVVRFQITFLAQTPDERLLGPALTCGRTNSNGQIFFSLPTNVFQLGPVSH
jgi:hypothetical protein